MRSKGGYDSISLVTTGNDYSPSCVPLPAAPPLRGPSDVERTFPLKDVTGFIARANYDANCSNDGRQRWIIGRHLADVIPQLTRLRLTKNGWRVPMRIGSDNYRSVMYLSIERLMARSKILDTEILSNIWQKIITFYCGFFFAVSSSIIGLSSAILNLMSISIRKYQFVYLRKKLNELQLNHNGCGIFCKIL